MCTLKKYREHDPNTIEAVQFTGENGDEIINLLNVSGGVLGGFFRGLYEDTSGEGSERVGGLGNIYGWGKGRGVKGGYVF